MDKVILFIPCYNCEKQIIKTLNEVNLYFKNYLDYILIVDNGSTDNTIKNALSFFNKNKIINYSILLNKYNYSLGGSHKVAFNYMIEKKYDYLITLHGDNQGDIKDIIDIFKYKYYLNYDCMYGARFHPESKLINYSKIRIFGNILFNTIFTLLLRKKIYDIGSGLNIYSKNFLKNKIYLNFPNSMMFNPYLHFYSFLTNSKTIFFPINWKEEDQISNVNFIKDTLKLCKVILILIFNKNSLKSYKFEKDIIYESERLNE